MTLEEALRQLKITSKARRLESLWPAIEAKLGEGVPHAEILRLLNEIGFEINERTYKSCLYRYRRRRRATGPECAPMQSTRPESQRADVAQEMTFPASTELGRHQRPPSFEFDPSGISPELLK